MYKAHFAACLMVNDEILREVRKDGADVIYLPFNTDYQIRLKNLDFRRAVVSVSIDGEDVLDGSRLVLDGNSTTDLKGFLDAKKNLAHNAFRFIEKTEKVSAHRGDRVDDGLLRIEVQFEEMLPEIEQIIKWPQIAPYDPWNPWWPRYPYPCPYWWQPTWHGTAGGGLSGSNVQCQNLSWSEGPQGENNYSINCSITPAGEAVKDSLPPTTNTTPSEGGITVTGGVVDQAFTTTVLRKLAAEKLVIVFKILGKTIDDRPVVQPLLVKSKVECKTCGTKCKSGVKFCPECGTCLL